MDDYEWPTLTPAQSARLTEVLSRPSFRSETGEVVCLRCGLTAERSKASPGCPGVPARCVCDGRLR